MQPAAASGGPLLLPLLGVLAPAASATTHGACLGRLVARLRAASLALMEQRDGTTTAAAAAAAGACQARGYAQAVRQTQCGLGGAGAWPPEPRRSSGSALGGGSSAGATPLHQQQPPHEYHQQQQQQQQPWRGDAAQQQWARAAQLPPPAAAALLARQPHLRAYLDGGFQPAYLAINLQCLALHPAELAADEHAALRGLVALLPPGVLQQALRQAGGGGAAGPLSPLQPHDERRDALLRLARRVEQALRPTRRRPPGDAPPAAHGAGRARSLAAAALWQPGQQREQQQQARQRQQLGGAQGLAAAVAEALGVDPSEQLCGQALKGVRLPRHLRAAIKAAASSSGGSSGGSAPRVASGAVRPYTTSSAGLTVASGLTLALERTARSVACRSRPLPQPGEAAQLARGVQAACGGDQQLALSALLQRPAVLWQHAEPHVQAGALAVLQQRLPGFSPTALVRRCPRLLSCSADQAGEVLELLLTRLRLEPAQAAALLQRHPQLLLQPVQQASVNLGFLVGLGLRPADLAAMAVRCPKWLLASLRDLSVQWHFVQTVLKGSLQDLVLLPQLLTTPIATRLGPRVQFARKRHIKLVLPSHAAMLPSMADAEWLQHKLMPLQLWLSRSDAAICAMAGLSADDYSRFKAAWARVEGASWARLGLGARPGEQQLVLSGQEARW